MTTQLTRRGILKTLGIGAAAALIEEPIRKLWFVGSNAPVGSRVERLEAPEVAGWVNVGPYAVPVGEDHVAALNSSWWQDQIDGWKRATAEIGADAQRLMQSMYAEQDREFDRVFQANLLGQNARRLKALEPAIKEALSKGHWYHA